MKQCWDGVSAAGVTGQTTVSSCWGSQQVTLLGFEVLGISQKASMTRL